MAVTRLLLRLQPTRTKDASSLVARVSARTPAAPISREILRLATVEELRVGGQRVIRLTPRTGATGAQLVYLHGGAYVYSLVTPHWQILARLIALSGVTVTVPFYGLAPEHSAKDAYELLDEVWADTARRSDGPVFVGGDSAGGALALGLAMRLRDAQQPQPRAVILFSPWLDITLGNPEVPGLAKRDPMLARAGLVTAGQWWADDLDLRSPLVSPLFGDLTGLPPLFVYQGGRDLLAADAQELARKVSAAGGRIELRFYTNAFHVFVGAPWTPEAKRALAHVGSVLRGDKAPRDRKLRTMTPPPATPPSSRPPSSSSGASGAPATLTQLSGEKFASLTTFRKTGVGVPTPVWVARDGDALIVVTPSESGKVKRLRNNSRVELAPCNRTGKVPEGALPTEGVAEILDAPADVERLTRAFREKYGLEYRVVMLVERIAARRQKPRVMLRITPPAA
ncbi:PPOX class F420-dependent oxidoreductase [Subtercola boreus]|nr:PPOX class F420-dependent oxidoreductase [Subtercola boreus]